jgi:hypothetical protein
VVEFVEHRAHGDLGDLCSPLVKLRRGDRPQQPDHHHPLHYGVGHKVFSEESVLQLVDGVALGFWGSDCKHHRPTDYKENTPEVARHDLFVVVARAEDYVPDEGGAAAECAHEGL